MSFWKVIFLVYCLGLKVTLVMGLPNTPIQDDSPYKAIILDEEAINYERFINDYSYILDDPERALTIDDVKDREFISYGRFAESGRDLHPDHAFWTRYVVTNRLENFSSWIIRVNALNSVVEMYVRQNDGSFQVKRTGEFVPVSEREFPMFNGAAFTLDLPYGETKEIFFKFERFNNFNPRLNVGFETRAHWDEVTHNEEGILTLGFVQGALWIVASFFLFYYFSSKSKVYLYYAIFLVFQAMFFLTENFAYPIQWLLGDRPQLFLHFWVIGYLIYAFFAIFVRSFIQSSRLIPKWDFLFVVMISVRLICALIALIILTFWYDYRMADLVYGVYLVPFEMCCWAVLIPLIFYRGNRIVRFFMMGVTIYIFTAVFMTYVVANTDLDDDLIVYLHAAGIMLQFGFFSLVLGYRSILTQQEKNKAQMRYIEQLRKNHEMQERINQDLENKVKERTAKINIQNQALLLKSKRLKELDQMKSRFLANISHEFRTPLTLIQGTMQKLQQNTENETLQSEYGKIIGHGQSLLDLINQLLELSQQQEAKISVNVTKIDVVEFVRSIAYNFQSLSEIQHINFHIKLPKSGFFVECDPDKLRRILENLLSNAFKFTQAGGEVNLVLFKHQDGANYEIQIEDTGIGIPEDSIDQIFERFFRVELEHSAKAVGTGIGLSLVREYVQMMHGKIKVDSSLGKGSCFCIKLPVAVSNGKAAVKTDRQVALNLGSEGITSNKIFDFQDEGDLVVSKENDKKLPEILIVEDNKDLRSFMKDTLQEEYFIIEARHGMEGLTMAKSYVPDLILSDVMMPGMNGLEFCKKVKNEPLTNHIPVIMLTAKGDQESRMEGWDVGADDFITKPFDLLELKARIKNVLKNRKQLQQKYMKSFLEATPRNGTKSPEEDLFLEKLESILEKNYQRADFQVEDINNEMGMSRSPFYRKLKSLTGENPKSIMRKFRLKRAAHMIAEGGGTIAEIADEVGFNSDSYFTKCFVDEFGHRPSEHREKIQEAQNNK